MTSRRTIRKIEDALGEALRRALRPYQLDWLARSDPYIAHLGARQIGKDKTWSADIVAEALVDGAVCWQAFSCTAPKASEFLEDCRGWDRYFRWAVGEIAGRASAAALPAIVKNNATQLSYDNGSTISSRAPTVRSTVGIRGSVLLNELGQVPHAKQLFEAAYPVVRQARANGQNRRMVVVSNATARGSFWHEFFESVAERGRGGWVAIRSTWADCMSSARRALGWADDDVAEWLAKERRSIQATIGAAAFAQWFDCTWRARSGYFDDRLLTRASYDPGSLPTSLYSSASQVIGYDPGRHRHPYAMAPILLGEPKSYALATIAEWSTPYQEQIDRLAELVEERPLRRLVVDATGGSSQAEAVADRFGSARVELFNFGGGGSFNAFSTLKDQLERGRLYIDRGDLDLRMELEGVETKSGKRGEELIVLSEERVSSGGVSRIRHADRAAALAMGAWAMVHAPTPIAIPHKQIARKATRLTPKHSRRRSSSRRASSR